MSGREKVREEKGRMEVLQERVEEFIPPFLPFITVTNWICSFLMQYLLVHLVISSTLSASFSGEREAGAEGALKMKTINNYWGKYRNVQGFSKYINQSIQPRTEANKQTNKQTTHKKKIVRKKTQMKPTPRVNTSKLETLHGLILSI